MFGRDEKLDLCYVKYWNGSYRYRKRSNIVEQRRSRKYYMKIGSMAKKLVKAHVGKYVVAVGVYNLLRKTSLTTVAH